MKYLLIVLAFLSFHSTGLSADELYIVGQNRKAPVAVSLRITADYIVLPLSVTVESKDASTIIESEREAARKFYEAVMAKKSKLSAVIVGFDKQPYLYLTYPITSKEKRLSLYMKEIDDIYKTVFSQGKSKCTLGGPVLALGNVDKYRQQLITLICSDAQRLTKSLGEGLQITISGLESPVSVKPVSDYDVEVFINYQMSVETTRLSSPTGPAEVQQGQARQKE